MSDVLKKVFRIIMIVLVLVLCLWVLRGIALYYIPQISWAGIKQFLITIFGFWILAEWLRGGGE